MNLEQEMLLKAWADDGKPPEKLFPSAHAEAIKALAEVLLDLAKPARRGVAHSIRIQMEHAVEDLRRASPTVVVDNLLDILEQDPGHDVTSYVLRPTSDRTQTVEDFRLMIQAIRRGE